MKPLAWLTFGLLLAALPVHYATAEDAAAENAAAKNAATGNSATGKTDAGKPASGSDAGSVEQDSEQEARKSLGRWWRFPWYDSSKDDIKPVLYKPSKSVDIPLLKYIAYFVLAIVLAVLVWLIISALLNRVGSPAREVVTQRVATRVDHVEALPFLRQRSFDDLLGQAREHYLAGNYDEAIIYLFSYQLVELDHRNLIRLAVGKTNRQYLRELRGRGTLAGLVEQTMVAFEDVYFGGRRLSRPQFESAWNRLPEFESLVASFGSDQPGERVSAVEPAAVLVEAVSAQD